MRKGAIIFICLMCVVFISATALAQPYSYCKDFLESGNPGGWTLSWQTYDDEWTLGVGEEVDVDIWINDLPESLITGGAWLVYYPAQISVVSVEVYELGTGNQSVVIFLVLNYRRSLNCGHLRLFRDNTSNGSHIRHTKGKSVQPASHFCFGLLFD